MILFNMKCIICEVWSYLIICKRCQYDFLQPRLYKREIRKNFFIYSFYNYEEIQDLLSAKYHFCGDRILNILALNSFALFAKEFSFNTESLAIPIDDHTRHEFSHTAILTKHLNSKNIISTYNVLKAQNKVVYAGKKLSFRKKNPRNFILKNIRNKKIILVDDVLTSGTTLKEAFNICSLNNEVLFALCLADAKHRN